MKPVLDAVRVPRHNVEDSLVELRGSKDIDLRAASATSGRDERAVRTWSAVVGPPRGSYASGSCLISCVTTGIREGLYKSRWCGRGQFLSPSSSLRETNLPAIDTHRPERQERHRPVSFTKHDACDRSAGVVLDERQRRDEPLRTLGSCDSSVTDESIQLLRESGMSSGVRGVVVRHPASVQSGVPEMPTSSRSKPPC